MDQSKNDAVGDLTGQCLIAMPGMGDPRFAHSVVYLCSHSEDGAMGLIVNKPAPDLSLTALLEQLDLPTREADPETPVFFGGPVETGRGFVLHGPDYRSPVATLEVSEDLHMTATLDVLEEIGKGEGPARYRLALGYSGWGPGQLEGEIAENGWLMCPGTAKLVLGTPIADMWEAALQSIGISALALSSESGRA